MWDAGKRADPLTCCLFRNPSPNWNGTCIPFFRERGEMVATLAKIIKEDIYEEANCTGRSFIVYIGLIIRSRTCCHSFRQGSRQGYVQSYCVLGERNWQGRKSVTEIRVLSRLPSGSSPSRAGRNSAAAFTSRDAARDILLPLATEISGKKMPNEALLTVVLKA